jgi:hypothetical protein
MASIKKGAIIVSVFALVLIVVGFMVGRSILYDNIRQKLEDQLHALRDSGYIIRYDSITIDWNKNEVAVYQLSVKREVDTTLCSNSNFISSNFIKAKGLRILPLLFKSHLSFASLEFDSSHLVLHQNFLSKEEVSTKPRREFTIKVDDLTLPSLHLDYFDSIECKPRTRYSSNVAVTDFVLSFYKDQPAFYNLSTFAVDSVKIDLPFDFYTLTLNRLKLDIGEKNFHLDTLKIIPHLSKIAFGRKVGFETDRFEGSIPYINLYGLVINRKDSLTINADKMTAQFFLKVFRDKRLPFKNKITKLPIDQLRNLSMGLKIPLLVVNKSYVQYEEFSVGADSAGRLYFDDVYATLKNLDNTDKPGSAATELTAECAFMGNGKLQINGQLPLQKDKKYSIKGSLENFDFPSLNAMLEPAVKVRAESGKLNRLAFAFTYDDNRSKGSLNLDYNNLRLTTFKDPSKGEGRKKRRRKNSDDDGNEVRKDGLKSFVVNAFIIRRNMDGNTPEEKKDGTISFSRDKSKSVFNYWSKSLLSGIKSAYNLDRLEDSRIKKMLEKKEK